MSLILRSLLTILSIAFLSSFLLRAQSTTIPSPPFPNEGLACAINWQDAAFGLCPGGSRNLIRYDFDHDGIDELFVNAIEAEYANAGDGYYWYVMKYNPVNNDYGIIYSSPVYQEYINRLTILPPLDDQPARLLAAIGNSIVVIELPTFSITQTIHLENPNYWQSIFSIELADLHATGAYTVLISSSNALVTLDALSLEIQQVYPLNGGIIKVGNVDDDINQEIVFYHGITVEIDQSGQLIEEYDFTPFSNYNYYYFELSDTDSDGKQEAIVSIGDVIDFYNIELEQQSYYLQIGTGVFGAMIVVDLVGDEKEEIVYKRGNNYYCVDSQTGQVFWQDFNSGGRPTDIVFGNFDQDESLEYIIGRGCFDSGSDHLEVYDVNTLELEWRSMHIEGPFHAIKTADLDGDGTQEIITLSTDSNDGNSGAITIYDGETKAILHRNTVANTFGIYTSFYCFEIHDFGNDGDLDIIIAANVNYEGKVWVLDGDDATIETSAVFPEYTEFEAIAIGDLDQDGIDEYYLKEFNNIVALNSNTLAVEWVSANISSLQSKRLLIGNIDSSPEPELISIGNNIYTYSGEDHTQSTYTTGGYYSTGILFDWNGNGNLELIAGTLNGEIHILQGESLSIQTTYDLPFGPIINLEIADYDDDGEVEIAFISQERIHFLERNGTFTSGQVLGTNVGQFNSFLTNDYDQDGTLNILIGTTSKIIDLNASCAACNSFTAEVGIRQPTCGENNGAIIGLQPEESYTFLWEETTSTDSISLLGAGDYIVIVTNAAGCKTTLEVTLNQQLLTTQITGSPVSCFSQEDGTATISILTGNAPYTYQWSDGQTTPNAANLPVGEASVTISDANNCVVTETVFIEQSSLVANLTSLLPDCNGLGNGGASVEILTGLPPYTYNWDGEEGQANINNLATGTHTLVISDSNGCSHQETFDITASNLLFSTQQESADCNESASGSAAVSIIAGTAPYNYVWSNTTENGPIIAGIPAGPISVTVTDSNGCSITDSTIIESVFLTVEVEVIPLLCADDMDASITLTPTTGTPPFTFQWGDGNTSSTINNLGSGNYFALVEDSSGCNLIQPVIITNPQNLTVNIEITDDLSETPEPDGIIQVTAIGGTPPYLYSWADGGLDSLRLGLAPGEYNLLISDANSCTEEFTFTINLVSSAVDQLPKDLLIFPNPATTFLSFQYPGSLSLSGLKLNTLQGKEVKSFGNLDINHASKITLPPLPAGAYLLSFMYQGNHYQHRLIITP